MPVVFMAAKAKDRYRKPMTGMWDWFERECNHGTPVGKYQSPTNESGGNTYVANSIERLFLSLFCYWQTRTRVSMLAMPPEERQIGNRTKKRITLPQIANSQLISESRFTRQKNSFSRKLKHLTTSVHSFHTNTRTHASFFTVNNVMPCIMEADNEMWYSAVIPALLNAVGPCG